MQRETGTAKSEGTGSAFEQFLELVPNAIVEVDREGEIVLVVVLRDGTEFPVEIRNIGEPVEPGLATTCGIKAARRT